MTQITTNQTLPAACGTQSKPLEVFSNSLSAVLKESGGCKRVQEPQDFSREADYCKNAINIFDDSLNVQARSIPPPIRICMMNNFLVKI